MEFSQEVKQQLKEIILKAIKLNGGTFDRVFKKRLKTQLTKKLRSIPLEQYKLISAIEISPTLQKNLTDTMHIPSENTKKIIDTNILGGFIVKSNSKMIDASINGYITNLTQSLYESA